MNSCRQPAASRAPHVADRPPGPDGQRRLADFGPNFATVTNGHGGAFPRHNEREGTMTNILRDPLTLIVALAVIVFAAEIAAVHWL
jgi:hypothetical protein